MRPEDTGTINGKQQGLLMEFKRQIPDVGEQQWTGGLALTGRELMMEGRIDGPGGPCTFSHHRTLSVARFDRFARSTRHLILALEEFNALREQLG
jgi:hypothetical protein